MQKKNMWLFVKKKIGNFVKNNRYERIHMNRLSFCIMNIINLLLWSQFKTLEENKFLFSYIFAISST